MHNLFSPFLFSEEKIAEKCKQNAQHHAGSNRKIQTEIFPFDFYVPRKFCEETELRRVGEQHPERYEH